MAKARDVVERANKAFNAHDADRIRSFYDERAVFTAPGEVRLEGPDAITEYAMSWLNAFPDAELQIRSILEEGNMVAVQFMFEGTHTSALAGPEGDIPPTNRRLAGRGAEVWRIEDGKIVAEDLYFDQVQVMTQLGLMPEPATS